MSTADSDHDGAFAPLDGITVADFTTNLAGPYATMILAQLGARVVKVEPPQGDDVRGWTSESGDADLMNTFANVGKRAIVLDLKTESGREIAQRLMGRSDVVLQSMRPGVAERLGIGADDASAANPDVLYYDVNAFGSGPEGEALKGYDPLVQAFVGIMAMTGHEGTPPTRCAPSIIDLGTGQWVAMGIVVALLAQSRGRQVRRMETALVDTAFSVVSYQATDSKKSGTPPVRAGSGNPIAAPYQCFAAHDGYILVAAPSQRLWERVTEVLEAPELLTDERFRAPEDRSRNRDDLEEVIEARLATADVDDWLTRFDARGVPAGRVQGLHESVVSEVAQERGTFLDCDGTELVRLPWVFDGAPIDWRTAPPAFGEHTIEVLSELGYSAEEVSHLLEVGAAASADT
jgi:crotonobetainyl-CoA:carnitine CoA-transferase CaiB-like acyl-CoA transferase